MPITVCCEFRYGFGCLRSREDKTGCGTPAQGDGGAGKKNATCCYGLQFAGVTQRTFIPPPSPDLAIRTFVTGRTGRLATTDSPALSGRAPEPYGSGVRTLRSSRRRPIAVVSFSDWLSNRSQA